MEHHFKSRLSINGSISHAGMERRKRGGYLNERRALADNVFRFVSGPQHDQHESVRHHLSRYIPHPFLLLHKYSSTASLSRREPNGDVMVTQYVNTACGAKMGQIDGQNLHAVAGTHSHYKGNEGQYVVWHGSGLSQIRSGFVVGNIPTLNQHAQENRPSNSLIHQMSTTSVPTVAHQSRHTRLPNGADVHPIPAFQMDTDWVSSHPRD